jgi:predicted  nucleic acid-binding Zn-ribbon protein
MPHQCTDCGRTFDDGSTEMLSGCPDCGGTTFQYRPEGTETADTGTPADPPVPEGPADGSVARTVGSAATAVRDLVGGGRDTADPPDRRESGASGPSETADSDDGPEDAAQASARSEVVTPENLPPAPDSPATTDAPSSSGSAGDESGSRDRPDLQTLRAELNDQFESIRVLEPGQYELNLMELYDREEYIIALQEDGKYTIQVPERWNEE